MNIRNVYETTPELLIQNTQQDHTGVPQVRLDGVNNQAIDNLNARVKTDDADKPKTTVEFLDKILTEQPLEDNPKEKKVYLNMEFSKPAEDMTVFDYKMDLLRAEYKQAGYGLLTDSEIFTSEAAFETKGYTRRWDGFTLESLQESQKKGKRFYTSDFMIERAKRGGQAVLQYQQYKANLTDELNAKAASKTNQMLLDPLRLGGNIPFRWAERVLNTPRDILQQVDRGEIIPGSSTAKWLGREIAEGITGKEAPEQPTLSETIKKVTGVELPEIPEVKLPRPFEYQTEKYKREGQIGEDIGATAIDLFLLKRGITGKSKPTPESLKSLGGVPKTNITPSKPAKPATPVETQANIQAANLIKKARTSEPQITDALIQVSRQTGGKMVGLENRIKSQESLSRKINDRVQRRIDFLKNEKGKDIEQANKIGLEKELPKQVSKMNDVLRYTTTFSDKNYASGISKTLTDLQKQGYKIEKFYDGWALKGQGSKDTGYRGVNVTIRDKNGQQFELQFHTEKSFATKTKTHNLYEEARNPETPKQRVEEIRQIQVKEAEKIILPKDVDSISKIIEDLIKKGNNTP